MTTREESGQNNHAPTPAPEPASNLGATLLRVAWLAILLGLAMEALLSRSAGPWETPGRRARPETARRARGEILRRLSSQGASPRPAAGDEPYYLLGCRRGPDLRCHARLRGNGDFLAADIFGEGEHDRTRTA